MTDWDLLYETQQHWFHPSLSDLCICHIKGHSDRKAPLESLSTDQLMNVRADAAAAKAYQQDLSLTPSVTSLFTHTQAHLHVTDGHTITSHHKQNLILHRTRPIYLKKLQQRWDWVPLTLHHLDWRAFQTVTMSTVQSKLVTPPTMCKLTNNLLPIGRRINRVESHRPSICPLCSALEDDIHLPLCKDPLRAQWRAQLLKAIDRFFEDPNDTHHASPDLCNMIRTGITQFLFQLPHNSPVQDPDLREVWNEQTRIGWYHFFTCRISKSWKTLQAQHLRQHPSHLDPPPTATAWINALLHTTQNHWAKLWSLRNDAVHGVDPADSATKLQALLWSKIRLITALHLQLDPSLQSFLDCIQPTPPASTFLLQHWIHSYKDLFKSQAAAYKKAQRKHMLPLSHYFERPPLDT